MGSWDARASEASCGTGRRMGADPPEWRKRGKARHVYSRKYQQRGYLGIYNNNYKCNTL